MRFTAAVLSTALVGLAVASPAARRTDEEAATVENLTVRENYLDTGVRAKAYSFTLNTDQASGVVCSYSGEEQDFPVGGDCYGADGEATPYVGSVAKDSTDGSYTVQVSHFYGRGPYSGSGSAPVVRRAGGDGPTDYVAEQVGGPLHFSLVPNFE